MVLGDTADVTCTRISSLDAIRAATAARTMRRYEHAVQNLVYGYGIVPQTTAESSDTPPIYWAIDMFIQLPAGLKCDPVLMTEVVQQE